MLLSCKLDKAETPQPQITNRVTIDGYDYHTAKIGTQTWTTVNYKGSGGTTYTLNGESVVGPQTYYTYNQALAIALPTGWRLPTRADYNKLLQFIGGTTDAYGDGTATGTIAGKLVASSWSYAYGDNSTGFSAAATGFINSIGPVNQGVDVACAYWTSTSQTTNVMSYSFGINNYVVNGTRQPLTAYIDYNRVADQLSLRFVKDN